MDIVERLRLGDFSPFSGEYIKDADKDEAADEIERLRKALQTVVDAHGTGQGIGAQGVGGWLDQARQTLEEIK